MDCDDVQKRMHALFSGRVQGVGFRYTACRIAESFRIFGFVRNLWDGDVEVVAEGSGTALLDFLAAIRNSPLRRFIVRDRVTWGAATGEYDRFEVSF